MCFQPAAINGQNTHLRSLRRIDHSKLSFTSISEGRAVCKITLLQGEYGRIPTRAFIINDDGSAVASGPNVNPILLLPVFGFLVKRSNGQRAMFDLALRPPSHWTKPQYKKTVAQWALNGGRGIPKILSASSISLSSISTILLGHAHVDDVGDLRPFLLQRRSSLDPIQLPCRSSQIFATCR